MQATIRPATEHELGTVHAIMMAAFATTAGYKHPSSALQETLSDLRRAVSDGGAILAFADGRPVGSGRFKTRSATTNAPSFLSYERLAVLPAVAGRGVGSAMVRWLEAHAAALGLEEIRVAARSQQPDNRPFYLERGYKIVGYSERYGVTDIRTHLTKRLMSQT